MRFEVIHISGKAPTKKTIEESTDHLDAARTALMRRRSRMARARCTLHNWRNGRGFGYIAPNGTEGIVFIVSKGAP